MLFQPALEPCDWRCLGDVCESIDIFGEVVPKEYIAGFTTISNEINVTSLSLDSCPAKAKSMESH